VCELMAMLHDRIAPFSQILCQTQLRKISEALKQFPRSRIFPSFESLEAWKQGYITGIKINLCKAETSTINGLIVSTGHGRSTRSIQEQDPSI
jgi:hypothetical protein